MSAEFKLRLKDHTGSVVDELSDQGEELRNLSFQHVVNGVGVCSLELDPNTKFAALFRPDYQIEIFRRNPALEINNWLDTPEWEGLLIDIDDFVNDQGRNSIRYSGVTYNDLLRRRSIGYPAETSFTSKTALGETFIKQVVNENAGPGANNVNRKANGVTPGLSIEADGGRGSAYSKKITWLKLFDVIKDAALGTGLYFDTIGIGDALFEFRIYTNQRGADHSNIGIGLDGLNAAGLPPVTFSTGFGNMSDPHYTTGLMNEINRVLVLGSGNETSRRVEPVNNAAAQALSPWAIRETTLQASQETAQAALQNLGNSFLLTNQAGSAVNFNVKQLASSAYGKHYTWGDRVVIQFKTLSFIKHLLSVKVDWAPGADEKISLEFGDVPA